MKEYDELSSTAKQRILQDREELVSENETIHGLAIKNNWKHGIYKDARRYEITKESDCQECIHKDLCTGIGVRKKFMHEICGNYELGDTTQPRGCSSCSNRFTRNHVNKETGPDKTKEIDKLPCFLCMHENQE